MGSGAARPAVIEAADDRTVTELPAWDAPLTSLLETQLPAARMRRYLIDRTVRLAVDTLGVRTGEQAVDLLWKSGDELSAVQAQQLYEMVKLPEAPRPNIPDASFAPTRPGYDAGPWLQALAGCFSEELEDALTDHSVVQQRRIDRGEAGDSCTDTDKWPSNLHPFGIRGVLWHVNKDLFQWRLSEDKDPAGQWPIINTDCQEWGKWRSCAALNLHIRLFLP